MLPHFSVLSPFTYCMLLTTNYNSKQKSQNKEAMKRLLVEKFQMPAISAQIYFYNTEQSKRGTKFYGIQ